MTMRGNQVKASIGGDPSGDLERPAHDLYRSHPHITEALLTVERFPGTTWECACGMGDMSEVLSASGLRVISTDLINYGYSATTHDFLRDAPLASFHNVVTNPPFSLAEEFAHRALEVTPATGKVALLCRLAWLEGSGRYRRLFATAPPTRIWCFSKRIAMARGYDEEFQTGLMAFCWIVWQKGDLGRTEFGWL